MNKCLCLDTRLETAAYITDSLGATVIYTKHNELKHSKTTKLLIPTQAHFHWLKFIKNIQKTPTCFGLRPSSGSYNVLAKVTII